MTPIIIRKTIEQEVGFSLKEKSRNRSLVEARSIYYKICREQLGMSFPVIGYTLGQDHSTVLYSVRNIFPYLKDWNLRYYEIYLDFMNTTDLALQTNKRINKLNEKQLNQVNILIDELTK